MKSENQLLGQAVKDYRKRSGLSQEELAEIVGVSRQRISHLERENKAPDLETMLRISNAIDMPSGLLFKGGDKKKALTLCTIGVSRIKNNSFENSGMCEITSSLLIKDEMLFCVTDKEKTYLASFKSDDCKAGIVFSSMDGILCLGENEENAVDFVAYIIADVSGYVKSIGY